MKIKKTMNGKSMKIMVEGRLDTSTAPQLDDELKIMLDEIDALELDLENLDYISSAGLRILLSTQKAMSKKGGMVVKNVNETVMEVLEVTGFVDILTIE